MLSTIAKKQIFFLAAMLTSPVLLPVLNLNPFRPIIILPDSGRLRLPSFPSDRGRLNVIEFVVIMDPARGIYAGQRGLQFARIDGEGLLVEGREVSVDTLLPGCTESILQSDIMNVANSVQRYNIKFTSIIDKGQRKFPFFSM